MTVTLGLPVVVAHDKTCMDRPRARGRLFEGQRLAKPTMMCAVSALTAKAKLAGMWREKVDQHNTGTGTVSTVWSVSWDEEGEQSDGREAS
jgi:hypothetical protein